MNDTGTRPVTKVELNQESHFEAIATLTAGQAAEMIEQLAKHITGEHPITLRMTMDKSYGKFGDRGPFLGMRIGIGWSDWGPSDIEVEQAVVWSEIES